LVGGPKEIIIYRNLTWIPSLIQASYAVVLFEEMGKTYDEIAEYLGLTKQTVRNMLRTDVELVKKKLKEEIKGEGVKIHTAGALARWAYEEIKKGNESISYLTGVFEHVSELIEISWPLEVLRRIKGTHFPIKRDELKDLLKNIEIEGKSFEEIEHKLPEEIKSPAVLLKEIKKVIKGE
jgi:probable regulatory domain-containing protein